MNEVFIADQTKVFLLSLLFGTVFCALYDIFRVLRKTVVKNKTAVFFTDILYWLLVTGGTLYIILIYCTGYVRGYVLVGIAAGFTIFRLAFSQILFRLLYGLFLLIRKIVFVLLIPATFFNRMAKNAVKKGHRTVCCVVGALKSKKIQKKPPQESKKA